MSDEGGVMESERRSMEKSLPHLHIDVNNINKNNNYDNNDNSRQNWKTKKTMRKEKKAELYSSEIKPTHLQLSAIFNSKTVPLELQHVATTIEPYNTLLADNNYSECVKNDRDNDNNNAHFNAKFQLNHPRGFRLLQDTSVIERNLHNYFRLPPAPSAALQKKRSHIRHAMRLIETRELQAKQSRNVGHSNRLHTKTNFNNINNNWQKEQFYDHEERFRNGVNILDRERIMSCSNAFTFDEVIEISLQDADLSFSSLEDLTLFTNLHSIDLSENNLTLSDVRTLPALQSLNLTCNEITSLIELHNFMFENTNNCSNSNYINKNNDSNNDSDSKNVSNKNATFKEHNIMFEQKSHEEECEESEQKYQEYTCEQENWKSEHLTASQLPTNAACKEMHVHSIRNKFFTQLVSLNLSYNRIPAHHIALLALLPSLEIIDLSGNELRMLPADMSQFTHLTHITLQYNLFSNSAEESHPIYNDRLEEADNIATVYCELCTANVFASLATAPVLAFVDVSHNKLSSIQFLNNLRNKYVKNYNNSGKEENKFYQWLSCLPKFVQIDLSYNNISEFTSLLSLAYLHPILRFVKLSHNPLCNSSAKRQLTHMWFDKIIVNLFNAPELFYEQDGINNEPTTTTREIVENNINNNINNNNNNNNDDDDDNRNIDYSLWHGEEWDQLLPTPQPNQEKTNHKHNMAAISAAAAAAAASCCSDAASEETAELVNKTVKENIKHYHEEESDNKEQEHHQHDTTPLSHYEEATSKNEWWEDVNEEYERLSSYKESEPSSSEHVEEHNESVNIKAQSLYTTADEYLNAFRIHLEFDDSLYRKPPLLRELYSTHPSQEYSHLHEEGICNGADTDSHYSKNKTNNCNAMHRLITIPPYNEFMDIYRLVRCVPPTERRRNAPLHYETTGYVKDNDRHKSHLSYEPKSSYYYPSYFYQEKCPQRYQQTEEEEEKELEYHYYYEEEKKQHNINEKESENEMCTNKHGDEQNENNFFITEVDSRVQFTKPADYTTTKNNNLAKVAKLTHSQESSLPSHLPVIHQSVISPSTMNVQHAMRELRMLLRKPLPPLSPSTTRM